MMPHQEIPSSLPGVSGAPDAKSASAHKTPLRTYSRRALKRRHTSPPAQNVQRSLPRTSSLNVTESKTAQQGNEAKAQRLSRQFSNKGRKRLRFSLASAEKTPSDLAWEALASSAPVLIRQNDGSSDEGGSHETNVSERSPDQKASEYQQRDVEDAHHGSNKGCDGKARRDATSEADTPESMSLEESDDIEDGEERQLPSDHEHR